MLEDVAERLRLKSSGDLPDARAAFSELDGFDVYAGDGHSHKHACHDDQVNGTMLCVTPL